MLLKTVSLKCFCPLVVTKNDKYFFLIDLVTVWLCLISLMLTDFWKTLFRRRKSIRPSYDNLWNKKLRNYACFD